MDEFDDETLTGVEIDELIHIDELDEELDEDEDFPTEDEKSKIQELVDG